jgi:hypothetical protein
MICRPSWNLSPEGRQRFEQRKEQLRRALTLAELRRAFSITQNMLARTLSRDTA